MKVGYTGAMDIEAILVASSYVGIFGLMIANGALSFPSSQVLYILVGYFVGTGTLALIPSALLGALGNTIGNVLLYEVIRRHGLSAIRTYQIFNEQAITRVEVAFRKRGLWFLFIGKLLPAIKVFVPIPAAIGKVHRGIFAAIMGVASTIWAFLFIAIGYFFGKSTEVWHTYALVLAGVAMIVLYAFFRLLKDPSVQAEVEQEAAIKAKDAPPMP